MEGCAQNAMSRNGTPPEVGSGWRADFQGRCENQEFRSPIFTLKIGERRSLALNSDFDGRRSHRSFPM